MSNAAYPIFLNEYQIANLRAAIEAAGYGGWGAEACPVAARNPLYALNTGDWLGEVYLMLPKVAHRPNRTPEEMAESARVFARTDHA
jgi:hypothetical protein